MSNSVNHGLIRRLDDLGRIVIPKEIRRELRLKENDPISISVGEVDNKACLILVPDQPGFRRSKMEALVKDIAQFMPSNCLVAGIPQWERPYFTNGKIAATDKAVVIAADEFDIKATNDLFVTFRYEYAGAKNRMHTVEVAKDEGPARFFTGVMIVDDEDGFIQSLVGVFTEKELPQMYRTNLECAISVFRGQMKE